MTRHPTVGRWLVLLSAATVWAVQAHSTTAPVATPRAQLCQVGETVYFSCSTRQRKQLALCGQLPGALQYRYGKPGRIELAYPSAPASGPQAMAYASYHRYQVQRQTVRFKHAGAEYTVFDYQEGTRRQSGVSVLPAGAQQETERLCTGPVTSQLPSLKAVLPCDADSALQGGTCP